MGNKTNKEDKAEVLSAELGLEALPEEINTEEVQTVLEEVTVTEEAPEEILEASEEEVKEDTESKKDVPFVNFKRMEKKVASKEVSKKRPSAKTKARTRQTEYEMNGNASLINFPVDRYGITRELKKVMTRTASRIAGDQKKKDLVLEVIDILVKHIDIKFDADTAYRKLLSERRQAKATK